MGDAQDGAMVPMFEGVMKLRVPPGSPGVPTLCALAEFFAEDGQQVLTVTHAVIHMNVEELAWAELTMFADADGRPVLDIPRDPGRPGVFDFTGLLEPDPAGGEQIRTRTFRYLIGFAQERPADGAALRVTTGGNGRRGYGGGGAGGSHGPDVVITATGSGMPGTSSGGGSLR